ncbi:hypothetical protein ACLB2K_038205 [Fragaria x ananassa]
MAPHRRLREEARGGVRIHVITYATIIVDDFYKSLTCFGPTLVALLMKKSLKSRELQGHARCKQASGACEIGFYKDCDTSRDQNVLNLSPHRSL